MPMDFLKSPPAPPPGGRELGLSSGSLAFVVGIEDTPKTYGLIGGGGRKTRGKEIKLHTMERPQMHRVERRKNLHLARTRLGQAKTNRESRTKGVTDKRQTGTERLDFRAVAGTVVSPEECSGEL